PERDDAIDTRPVRPCCRRRTPSRQACAPGDGSPCPCHQPQEKNLMFVQLLKDWKGKSAGERIDVPEEFAPLLLEQKVAQACEGPTPGLVARAAEQTATRLDAAITRARGQFADAQAQSRRHAVPALFGDSARPGDHDVRKNFGDWLLHVARQDDAYLEKT